VHRYSFVNVRAAGTPLDPVAPIDPMDPTDPMDLMAAVDPDAVDLLDPAPR
jgi:hypothetical protein